MTSESIILTLDPREESILLNEGVLNALDWPRQVQILINTDEKMLVLRACSVKSRQAVVIPDGEDERFEISCRSFLCKLRKLMVWEDGDPRICYGEYLPSLQAVRFSLADAVKADVEPALP